MGIDISMSMGFGIYIPQEDLDAFLDTNDADGEGFEYLYSVIPDNLTFEYVGDSWAGGNYGVTVYAKEGFQSFDMGRVAEAGVYRPGHKPVWKVGTLQALDKVSEFILGKPAKIEWLVSVSVS